MLRDEKRENLNLHKTDPPLKPPRWGGEEEEKFCENVSSSFGSWGPVVSFALILWEEEEGTFLFKDSLFESFKRALTERGFSGIGLEMQCTFVYKIHGMNFLCIWLKHKRLLISPMNSISFCSIHETC